jgi:hypothetical protein
MMKKQVHTTIGNGYILVTATSHTDVYSIELNEETGKFFFSSIQGINTKFQSEFKTLEAALKAVNSSIQNND